MRASRQFLIAAALAAAAIVFVYSNSLHNTFHFDDHHVIVNNVFIRSLQNVPLFFRDAHTFSTRADHATYRPLVTLTYAIDYAVAGSLDPVAFHVTQIVLLLMIWGMLVIFFRKAIDVARPSPRNEWIALAAATLWSIHTVNTETMNLISARSEELSALATLAAFLLIQFSPRSRRWHLYLIPIAIGALAKAQIVIFAPLLLVYLVFIEGRSVRKRATWTAIMPSAVAGVALLFVLNRMNSPEWIPGGNSKWHYFLTQGFAWMRYTRLFFVPVGLTADTDWKTFENWYDPRAIAGFVFVALLIALIRYRSRRDGMRPVAFGLSWYAVALLPTSSLYPLAEVVNEHRVFLPYMGLALAAVFSLDTILALHRRLFAVIAVAVIIALGAGTMVRNEAWATEETLWKDTIGKSPENGRALFSYGLSQMAKGNYAVAKSYYERAEKIDPAYPPLEINIGIVEGALSNNAAAENHFKLAIALSNDVDGHYYYGRWLVSAGRAPEAMSELTLASRIDAARPEPRMLLMKLWAAAGNAAELERLSRLALSYDPRDRSALAVLAGSVPISSPCRGYQECFDQGLPEIGGKQFLDAALSNRQAIRYDSNAFDAWTNLGWSLAQIGLDDEAEKAFRHAIELRPNEERGRNNLAWLLDRKAHRVQ
ncbi:MAG: protein O-mannosyl-transferase [Thermoanaerobaculia bacterium]|jgi:tetratricopeptide (TPR) repeat protein|nr:protein O-mannosyl-transferase [Thermoanaerobaculia bacterium]